MIWYKNAQLDQEDTTENPNERQEKPNSSLLAELEGKWFHAIKSKGIRAGKLDSDQSIQTLEGVLSASAGDWLCQGMAGEPWPQKEDKLFKTYDSVSGPDADGWIEFAPKQDAAGVNAAQVGHAFTVEAS